MDVVVPPPQYLPAFRWRVLVLFGGGPVDGPSLYADTWEYDGTTWRQIP